MVETIVSTSLTDATFQASPGIAGGETISGDFASTYNATGTLISETGTITMTETSTSGGVTTEIFTISGSATVANSAIVGTGIKDPDPRSYEIYLGAESSTGTGPTFTDLHLDWTSATNPVLYLGQGNGRYSALIDGDGSQTNNFLTSSGTEANAISYITCFASGTRILTEAGQVAVEKLEVGDVVITVRDGGGTSSKVAWTGKRSLDIFRHASSAEMYPVRIIAGAFGPGLPERDLRLSPHHAVYVDGVLIEALSLVNGATIIQEMDTRFVTYHHIELMQHDVMLAEGLPAESYLDTGHRNMFEGEGSMALHPDFRVMGDADFCAPMVRAGAKLETIRARLLARAEALGFTRTDAVDVTAEIKNAA
jgi:hypothetical protein